MPIELFIFFFVWLITSVLFIFYQGRKGVVKGIGGGFVLACVLLAIFYELSEPSDKIIDRTSDLERRNKAIAFQYTLAQAKEIFNAKHMKMEVIKYKEFKKIWGLEAKVFFDDESGHQCKQFTADYTGHFGTGELRELINEDSITDCKK
jgi:hypothetical protein